ncbi:MAG: extracellular solute-binding protein [Propionicimonas sp.]|nr:extracellular solute-binding protein [Propionicimonas sp.]
MKQSVAKVVGATALAGALLLAVGCQAPTTPSAEPTTTSSDTPASVVLYTSEAASSETIGARFTADTGIAVELVTGSSGELLSRVKGEAGNPQGDVYLSGCLAIAENTDVLTVYKAPTFDRIQSDFLGDTKPSPSLAWLTGLMYNSERVPAAEVPTSYADLADEKWRGQIAIADPAASSAAYYQILAIYLAGGWDLVEKVAKNLVISDNSAGPRAVSDGEVSLGLFNESAAAAYRDNPQVEMTYPKDGVIAGVTCIAEIAGSKRADGAHAFIDWFLGDKGQAMVATELSGVRPVIQGAPDPDGLPSLDTVKVVAMPADSETEKEKYLSEWENIITNI